MTRLQGWALVSAVATLSALVLAPAAVWAQPPQYSVVVLEISNTTASYAYGINASGQITGAAQLGGAGGQGRAVVWKNGTVYDLGTVGYPAALGEAINDGGQIAGYWRLGQSHAFLWNNGVLTDLPVRSDVRSSQAHGINASGQIVGQVSYSTLR